MISLNNSFKFLSLSCRHIFHQKPTPQFYLQCAGLRTTVEEKIGLPPRPKKPLTPYFRFMKQMRPNVVAENPNAKAHEVVKMLANKWESLDEASKKKLQEAYKKDQITYLETRTKYDSSITDEQRNQIKSLKHEIVVAKQKKELKKRVRELGKPKKASSAFIKFLVHERTATPQGPNQSYKEWHKKTSEKWTRLSDAEKKPFVDESHRDLQKYKKELAKWEEKMIRLGHIDVVRQESLIDPPETKSTKVSSKSKKSE